MKLIRVASFLLSISFILLSAGYLAAQSPAADSILYKSGIQHLVTLYHQASGEQSGLYNGSQYSGYFFSFTGGDPFFKDKEPGLGSVVYDGVLYENVMLQYDEIQDVVVMEDSARRIQLINDRIARFRLFDNNFIRIVKDTENAVLVRTGYYNLLYEGNISLLKKEEKYIREDPSTGVLLRFIESHVYYYLKRNNEYFSIKNKNSLLALFSDRKKEIRQYIRKNGLSYRNDRDNMLTKTIAYCDQLIK
ncbi:MAG: hypothetical protein ABI813_01905 [Bacteroidota bacterium]